MENIQPEQHSIITTNQTPRTQYSTCDVNSQSPSLHCLWKSTELLNTNRNSLELVMVTSLNTMASPWGKEYSVSTKYHQLNYSHPSFPPLQPLPCDYCTQLEQTSTGERWEGGLHGSENGDGYEAKVGRARRIANLATTNTNNHQVIMEMCGL